MFEYTATSPYELSIGEDDMVKVLEGDDGSGWIKVANVSGGKGLVPASYVKVSHHVEVSNHAEVSKEVPRASEQYGASVVFINSYFTKVHPYLPPIRPPGCHLPWYPLIVRGLFDYQATGEDEINVRKDSRIRLTTGPRGGKNYGDGWWEGSRFPLSV